MFLVYLFFNFVFVMMANRISPGVTIDSYEKVVNIGADLLVSFIIAFLNTLIVPMCTNLNIIPTAKKIIIFSAIISFGSYIALALIGHGVKIDAFYGVIIAGSIVSLGSIVVGLFYRRKFIRKP